jgi:hypothetical protein
MLQGRLLVITQYMKQGQGNLLGLQNTNILEGQTASNREQQARLKYQYPTTTLHGTTTQTTSNGIFNTMKTSYLTKGLNYISNNVSTH